MTLKDQIDNDSSLVFTNTSDFAETVTYYPHIYFGATVRASRSISAVVFRQQVQVLGEDGDSIVPIFEVHVANDSTVGISSDELDTGGDQIEFPPRDGKDAEKRTITHLVTQDHGMLVLQCQ
jgi:hypothetical protein